MRQFLVGLSLGYIAVGLFMGVSMASAIPALNWKGVAYYAAAWPVFLASGTGLLPITPWVPSWSFTFDRKNQSSHHPQPMPAETPAGEA